MDKGVMESVPVHRGQIQGAEVCVTQQPPLRGPRGCGGQPPLGCGGQNSGSSSVSGKEGARSSEEEGESRGGEWRRGEKLTELKWG